ncbi:hypothetical protein DVH24_000570 [Malus domestica]|uniref:Uncharacterized protein n=1 Tax=Malus domestica TaxID=3750 RepID=A0A498J685_MALDO|nr:hypothetical protein DVH24_000570 [Malus domestica]
MASINFAMNLHNVHVILNGGHEQPIRIAMRCASILTSLPNHPYIFARLRLFDDYEKYDNTFIFDFLITFTSSLIFLKRSYQFGTRARFMARKNQAPPVESSSAAVAMDTQTKHLTTQLYAMQETVAMLSTHRDEFQTYMAELQRSITVLTNQQAQFQATPQNQQSDLRRTMLEEIHQIQVKTRPLSTKRTLRLFDGYEKYDSTFIFDFLIAFTSSLIFLKISYHCICIDNGPPTEVPLPTPCKP